MTETVTKEAMPMEGLADWLIADSLDAKPRTKEKLLRWATEVEASRSLPVDGGVDERAAFEAWARDQGMDVSPWLSSVQHGYSNVRVNDYWDGWKGRAALAGAPAVQEREVPPQILAIIENLHTQDNRITANPLFAVQQKRVIGGLDEDYADKFAWVDGDGEVTDEDEVARLDALRAAGEDLPDDVRRVGFMEKWEFVTGCLTEQGCKDYIACNGHNLKEPRIYAYGAYRNAEFIAVRQWLMSLRTPALKGGQE